MPKLFSPRQAGEELDLPHLEVIRRIRRGDILASKLGWNWVIEEAALEEVRKSEWYQRRLARQAKN